MFVLSLAFQYICRFSRLSEFGSNDFLVTRVRRDCRTLAEPINYSYSVQTSLQ